MENIQIEKIKTFVLRKRILIPLFLIVVIWGGYKFIHRNDQALKTVTDVVKTVDLKQTVLATGQVTSNTDLNLSFNSNGTVSSVKVKVGDKVKSGQILATLSAGSVSANLTTARGAVAAAQARYKKILDGASNEEIVVTSTALDNAKRDFENTKLTQETLVSNAYNNLLSSYPEAIPVSDSRNYAAPVISGNYSGGKEGSIKISIYSSSGGLAFNATGLVSGSGNLDLQTAQPIGNSGLYIKLPTTGSIIPGIDWHIEIPNKNASNYLTNYNLYQNALKNQTQALSQAQAMIDQRAAELALKKSQARPADVSLAEADILQAQGQLELANASYENTVLRAPADGTITSVDIKIGELAQSLKEVMVLQDVTNMYLEANINEANIANVKIGAPVNVSFDAFGVDKIYKGNITSVDPSSTLVSGVVNYKIQSSVEKVDGLRPGMTANMTINVSERPGVLVVPARAILLDKNGNKIVRVVTNTKNKSYKEVPVVVGLEGDGGMTEIHSGLSFGDEFVVLIKQ